MASEAHARGAFERDLVPPDSTTAALVDQLDLLLSDRPPPLRTYDQIHMQIEDLARHIQTIAPLVAEQKVFFMGDSDGLVVGLACAAVLGLVPAPRALLLADFDRRVLRFVDKTAKRFGLDTLISTHLYNVFDPLPLEFTEEPADVFHTNPPYGQFNGGRSVMAFVERSLAATRRGGHGFIILANDPRYEWTRPILSAVTRFTLEKQLVPYCILESCHRYYLDDQPDLRSGIIFCERAEPSLALSPDVSLPASYADRFYGRDTIAIPRFISLEGEDQQPLFYPE